MSENKYDFKKLTPENDADITVYDDAIGFAFENDDVKNVAISGAYGSGKSSLIESYKTKHPEKRFIYLSLAHFRSLEQETTENKDDVKESVLEGKILNQLIHQISANKIPQTNFRVKKGVDTKSVVWLTVFISAFISCMLFLTFHNNIVEYTNALPECRIKLLLDILANPYNRILAILISMVCGIAFILSVVKAQMNRNILRKINMQGYGIEIFEQQDESYFDKYLNEVLYLFENAEADVIVFEDMDRFNACKIFERLREVNTLVNIHRKKQHKVEYVPLRFFYLIRDDIFISKDRTKFFDYIIPVVPIVDSSNSYEKFIKYFKNGGLLEKFDQSFLQGLSLYIDDMRILKNIYNEFVVYFNRLNTTDLDCDKMLAMIAYKNIFPRDFSNLQLKQGFIFEVFNQKLLFIDDEIKNLNIKRDALLEKIERSKNEFLIDAAELEDAYRGKKECLPKNYGNYTQSSLQKIEIYDRELNIRKESLQNKVDNLIPVFEKEVEKISYTISKIYSEMIKDIITRENIDEIFAVQSKNEIGDIDEFTEIRGSEYFNLLKYLIRNGFIDETYSDYMTYFYEDSISANDKIFLRRITDKRGAEYTYKLKEPMKVISSPLLRQVDFEEQEVLNFDLLHCLLDNFSNNKYDNYLKTLISQLKQNEKFDFMAQYYSRDTSNEAFTIKVNEYWNDFFYAVLKNEKFSKKQVREYSIETLYYSDDETLTSIDIDECLKDYISDSDDYLQIKEPDILKLIAKFKLLNVLFVTLDYDMSDKNLFKQVYQENLYAINFANIKLMLRKEYLTDDEDDIVHKNYTLIQSDADSPLAKYISNNLFEYIGIVLKNCGGKICDELSEATYLLNCDDLGHQQKEEYISVLSTTLNNISSISDTTLWHLLLAKGLVEFNEENVLWYYSQFSLVGELTDYINASIKPLNFTNTKSVFGEETAKKFFASVFQNNEIKTDKYRTILLDLGYYYNNFTSEDIEDEKMSVLIDKKIIRMTVENLLHLREHYSDHISEFIEINLDKYLELQTAEVFVLNEALQVIKFDFETDKKIEFITWASEPISIVEKGYEDELCVHILSHNLNCQDLNSLYQNYSMYQEATKEKIFELATANISDLVNSQIEVDDALLSLLFESDRIDFSYKVNLFDYILPKLNEEKCKVAFDAIGVQELKEIFTQWSGRKKYNITDENTEVLKTLKKHSWIYEYNIDEHNDIKKYTVIKNKPRKTEATFLD